MKKKTPKAAPTVHATGTTSLWHVLEVLRQADRLCLMVTLAPPEVATLMTHIGNLERLIDDLDEERKRKEAQL